MKIRHSLSYLMTALLLTGLSPLPETADLPIPPPPAFETLINLNGHRDFWHEVGVPGGTGWAVEYRKHSPGYLCGGLKDPILPEPGVYRFTFSLRRGNYPRKGLLYKSYSLYRLELWDATDGVLMEARELQIADFPKANRYEKKWMEVDMAARRGHAVEPRVYWFGLGNGEVAGVQIDRYPDVSLTELASKAAFLGDRLERCHIENGFVVSRKKDGSPDETGDATTYTAFYVASLAWKYAVTKDALTLQALENRLQALHTTIKGTEDRPYLTRYVDENGIPFPKAPSKDVYASFFFAYSAALPHIQNKALKKQMLNDLSEIANQFLVDGLTVKVGEQKVMSLTPYFTNDEIRDGIRQLFDEKDGTKKMLADLRQAKSYLPFTELWPGINKIKKALKQKDEEALMDQVVPAMNGLIDLAERVRDVLKEQYREDLFPKRGRNLDYPGKRLEVFLTRALGKLPPKQQNNFSQGPRFYNTSDLRLLASNTLISLHIIKTALIFTKEPQFDEYYKTNLYTQDALLKTSIDWFTSEEELVRLTSGNPSADRMRRGYLSLLSLYNLIQLETNPTVKAEYEGLLKRVWTSYQNDENPLVEAVYAVLLVPEKDRQVGLITKALASYPEDPHGFGAHYWKENGQAIADMMGGGSNHDYALEPLPISHRPRDSFLWQRNARRLKGDLENDYPGTDYLFVYWFCRYHKLIPPAPAVSNVQR